MEIDGNDLIKVENEVKVEKEEWAEESSNDVIKSAGETYPVCQKFFLNTLGYTQDQVIKSLFVSMEAGAKADAASNNKSEVEGYETMNKHFKHNFPDILCSCKRYLSG